MRKYILSAIVGIAFVLLAFQPVQAHDAQFDPVEYVNPLMGTQSTFELSTGNTYPAPYRGA